MLELNQIDLRRGARLLFENASLQAHNGQRMGVIGINGSGKSSLFAMILGELECDAGELRLNRKDVIAHVAQTSPSGGQAALDFVLDGDQGLRLLQAEIAAFEGGDGNSDRLHALYEQMDHIDGFTADTRAARLLHGLGFSATLIQKPVNQFSGGWRMRLNLAQALMCRSDILLLDEPTNHLDLPAIIWLERWLKSYEGILLVVSHDRDFLDGLCTHIAHIEHQAVRTYTGNYSQFEAVRAEQLALQQSMYIKQQKEIKHIQSFVDRFRYKASKAKQAQSRLKMLQRMTEIAPAHVDSNFHFHFEDPEKQPQQLVQLEDASIGYENLAIVDQICFRLGAGDRVGLLGANGAGKSTLVRALVDGSTLLSGTRSVHQHTRMGYFAQHQLELLRMDCSPLWHVQRLAPDAREQELRNRLGQFGFRGERIDEPVEPFSGGEKARLVLAMLVLQQPNLLLLDEPTNHLDLEMRHALSMALVEYNGALLVISHDRHLLRSVCDALYVVQDTKLIEFKEALDNYPAWVKSQQLSVGEKSLDSPSAAKDSSATNKRQTRRADAKRRLQLKPFSNRVRKIEQALNMKRNELQRFESDLQDESLYTDATRKQEMANLVQQLAECRAAMETLEWEWLEASEAYDQAAMNHVAENLSA